jgi:MFS transporter, DHA2 family, multidrug resistance protein
MGYPALQSGYAMSPRGIAAFFTTLVVGRLVGKIPMRWMLGFGFAMLSLSSYMLSGINLQVSQMASVILAEHHERHGHQFHFRPADDHHHEPVAQQQIGSGSGLYNLVRNLGGSIGIAFVTTLLARGAQTHQALMVGHLTPADPVFTQRLAAAQHALGQQTDPVTATHQAYGLIYNTLNAQAHLWAFVDTFRMFGLMVVCCLPLILLFKRVKRPVVRPAEVH